MNIFADNTYSMCSIIEHWNVYLMLFFQWAHPIFRLLFLNSKLIILNQINFKKGIPIFRLTSRFKGVTDVPSNIVVGYHGVTWTSSKKTANIVYDPDVNLVCQFDRLPDQSLYYDVTWYVDDTEVLTNQTVSSNSSDLALLTGSQMLAKGKKANSMVRNSMNVHSKDMVCLCCLRRLVLIHLTSPLIQTILWLRKHIGQILR